MRTTRSAGVYDQPRPGDGIHYRDTLDGPIKLLKFLWPTGDEDWKQHVRYERDGKVYAVTIAEWRAIARTFSLHPGWPHSRGRSR